MPYLLGKITPYPPCLIASVGTGAGLGVWDSDTDYELRDDRLKPALRGLGRALQVTEKWPATETVRILHVT